MPAIGEIGIGTKLGYTNRGKYVWHACEGCGKERWVLRVKGLPQFAQCVSCSRKKQFRVISSHPSWKGGRFTTSGGYISIRLQGDDFFHQMADKHNAVREHRLVMAKYLKRCLLPWEVVHHKNGIKDDNRIENLQLLPSRASHISDTLFKHRLKRLEILVVEQDKQIKLLKWRIKELEVQHVR